uniref:VWFA domain-containing protein n=2 Tax=Eptatretus burgeri TaxID=7764 RepID=A0A8C4QRR6_EPTBU
MSSDCVFLRTYPGRVCLRAVFMVAVAQYATKFKKEFDFHNFSQSPDPTRLVSRIQHMYGGTLTASAMLDVLKMMFLPEVGARKQAKKVMLVITDGETYDDKYFKTVIEESEKKDVIRFAVGVGKASEGAGKLQLEIIASKPIENHLFFVTDYRALAGILHKLQENIFIIEGESSNGTSFITELAEPGLGLHISKDVTLFGAPGMYDWTGAVLRQANGKLVTSIRDVKMKNRKATYQEASDSYIGYALSSVHLRSRRLIAAGAPRFRHTGKVMLMSLQADTGTMMLEQELLGFQLGSSFGSEMCSLDINNDGYTDMLLVSAPLYCVRGDEGRVYIPP